MFAFKFLFFNLVLLQQGLADDSSETDESDVPKHGWNPDYHWHHGHHKPTTQAPPSFICIPQNLCINQNGGGPVIDPRNGARGYNQHNHWTTPSPGPCPHGLYPCYQDPNGFECGKRFVEKVNPKDGTATLGAHPWQAFMVNSTGFSGSGVLVDDYHVLTAAHKVYQDVNTPGNIVIYLGVYDPASDLETAVAFQVVAVVVHKLFNPQTLMNDIAILRLNDSVPLAYHININVACLPDPGASFVGQRCVVAGWGQTQFNIPNSPISPERQVTVPIVSLSKCMNSMMQHNVLAGNAQTYLDQTGGELCAGGENKKDACTYDGGSPLMCADSSGSYTVAGLVIWGKNCGKPGVYGVYVNIAYYASWIARKIIKLNAQYGN